MSWIETIEFDAAKGKLKTIYERVKGPDNNVDNILMAHSLRPHTLEGHMTLYKYVLHHPGNMLPKWLLETIGTYVSILNNCPYCIDHHFAGLSRLIGDQEEADRIKAALAAGKPEDISDFSPRETAALHYAAKLTTSPSTITEADIENMRDSGLTDGEILEVNQVSAYFAYANRTVLGLGVNTDGDIIGLSPNDNSDPDNWGHQ